MASRLQKAKASEKACTLLATRQIAYTVREMFYVVSSGITTAALYPEKYLSIVPLYPYIYIYIHLVGDLESGARARGESESWLQMKCKLYISPLLDL